MKTPAPHRSSDEILLFSWKVPAVGFAWRTDAHPDPNFDPHDRRPSPYLVQLTNLTKYKETHPFNETPNLFLDFLRLSPTPEAILHFANRHGPLGGTYQSFLCFDDKSPFCFGESLSVWKYEIDRMHRLWTVWEGLSQEVRLDKQRDLARSIKWDFKNKSVFLQWPPYSNKPARKLFIANARSINPEVYAQFRKGDVIEPAKAFLVFEFNERLYGRASPAVFYTKSGKLRQFLIPHDLLTALWIQFHKVITGERSLKRCIVCKEWMDISENRKTKRVHTKCSRNQRQKKWRKKPPTGGRSNRRIKK